jgi:hypothetical protein
MPWRVLKGELVAIARRITNYRLPTNQPTNHQIRLTMPSLTDVTCSVVVGGTIGAAWLFAEKYLRQRLNEPQALLVHALLGGTMGALLAWNIVPDHQTEH